MRESTTTSDYKKAGFISPIEVLSNAEVETLLKSLKDGQDRVDGDEKKLSALNSYPHFLLPHFNELISHQNIVQQAKKILGENLIVWGVSLFIKEAHSQKIVSWHQDLTHWDLDDAEEVTCWVALSKVTKENGCMRFVPGSHMQKIVPHNDTFDENNMLSRGQEIAVEVNEADAVHIELKPGQASFHHGHLFHASGPNTSDVKRVGVAIRYIKTSMRQASGERPAVYLASGRDDFGYFENAASPSGLLTDEEFNQCFEENRKKQRMLFQGTSASKGSRYQ